MSDKRANIEIIAPSVEEAVAKGLADLALPEEAVEIEILDEGSRGLFGLGARQARVRLTIKASKQGAPSSPQTAPAAAEAAPEAPSLEQAPVEDIQPEESRPEPEPEPSEEEALDPQDEIALHVARETVVDLLDRMKVEAEITAYFGEPDDARSRAPLIVDIRGDDLSILIGPRAETLNALQYISSLIIGKELARSVPLLVDVEGYRVRRAQEIRQLARSMADQAIKTGRRQKLEPMPANERRLVHIELRNNPEVTTESIGEDPRRKVTIIPKNS
jgi:spoIIIJ-associated protein